jgi:hypothetical protein
MESWRELLFERTWWTWNAADKSFHSVFIHWFNLFEGCAWVCFAGLVLNRFARHRKSRVELAYATAFLVFGLTDFLEAHALSSWLLWVKLVNLLLLWRLRSLVMKRWYPQSRVY